MKENAFISRFGEGISAFLLAGAFATAQVLIGGTRLLFSLPAYGLLGLAGLLTIFSLHRAKPKPNQLCLVSAALFSGYVLTRALLSPVDYLARADLYSVLGGLLVYFSVACIFTSAKRRMLLLGFLLAVALVHVAIGAIQFRDGQNFMLIPFLQRFDYERRASGFYVCPNHLAGLLEVLGVFGLSIVFWSRWPRWAKLFTGYAVFISYLGLALTGSRGGYLSAIASLLLFAALSLALLRKAQRRLFWRIGAPALIVAAVMAVTAILLVQKSSYLSNRAQTVFDLKNERFELWKAAIQQWKLQPVFGTGSRTYLYYGRQFRTEQVQRDPVYVHNDYLQLLSEYGLVGIAFSLVFLGSHLRQSWKNLQRLGFKRVSISPSPLSNGLALQLGALAAILAYVVHSFLDFNLHIPANALLLAFVFGVVANPGIPRETEAARPPITAMLWPVGLTLLGVAVLIQCVRLLPGEYFTELARTALRNDQLSSAQAYAERGLSYEQRNPNLYQYLGSAQLEQGDQATDPEVRTAAYQAAIKTYERARALAPREKTFALALGFLYDATGRFEEGEWMLGEAFALDPKSSTTPFFYKMHLQRWRGEEKPSVPGPK